MKYKILGYVFLGLVLAAIVGWTLVYQISHNTSFQPVDHSNDLKTYTAPGGDFQLVYPKEDVIVQPDEQGQTYFKDAQIPDVEVHVPMSAFPNTNFAESYVVVATDSSIKNAADCKKYSNGASQLKTTDKSQTVNGIKFDSTEFTGAAAGNIYDTRLFRVFHGGTCYEISVTLHTTNIQNYPAGAVTEVNKDSAWNQLMQILNSFKFTDKQAGNPQCGGIAGRLCPPGQSCSPDGSYPDAGGSCVKPGDGVLKGHVDIGPLCAGPERADQPCTKQADYSGTHILVYPPNNQPVQTLSVDSSGDYSVDLAAGKYFVKYSTNYGLQSQIVSQAITISSGKTATQNFTIDTGIR